MPFVGSLRMQTTGDSSAKIQTTDPSLEDVRGQVGWKWSHREGSWWTIFWDGEFIPKIGRWCSEMEVRQEYVASFRVSPDSHYSADISKMLRLQEPFQPPKDETLWHGDLAKATPSKLFMMLVDYSKAHGTLKKLKAKVKRHNPTNIFGAQTNSQAVSIRYIYIHLVFSFTRVALWGCQGRTCSRYQWWCHVRYHRGGTIQFEGQWSGENHGWMAWREMRVRKQDFNSAIKTLELTLW